MKLYKIKDWDRLYENNRTRELKNLGWVPVPNKHDGDGFTDLITRENGTALFGAWNLILQLASKCDPRGTLSRTNPAGGCGDLIPHDSTSISRVTRGDKVLIEQALDVCLSIGWLESIEIENNGLQNPAGGCEITAPIPQDGAQNRTEQNRTERTELNISVLSVFEYWKKTMNHELSKLDDKRKTKIRKAFELGYTEEDLKAAIDGCKKSDWHMGRDKNNNKVYDELELIIRDGAHIDKFIKLAAGSVGRDHSKGF